MVEEETYVPSEDDLHHDSMENSGNCSVLALRFVARISCFLLLQSLSSYVLFGQDSRNIQTGLTIPGWDYCDQPYLVQTDDGAWLCAMTTARGKEGSSTQTVISMRSTDQGKTWSEPVSLEPQSGPETSYAVLLKVPYGRIYCFYNHNTDNVREVKTENGPPFQRVDSLGHYVFKFSDDHGQSWSPTRYEVPVREFECDRNNVYAGQLRFFWNVGRPLLIVGDDAQRMRWTDGECALLTLHKVGAMGNGFFAQSEGALLRATNITHERDPAKLIFATLPDGDIGLRTPPGGGRVAEEQSLVQLSDGSLYVVYRSVDGHPVCSYSRDGGRNWSLPQYKCYAPNANRIKHPRAANFVWKCSNGKYLYWFHNHGPTETQRKLQWDPYLDRNPAWLSCGEEVDGPDGKILAWSQPEIVLYDADPFVRISYPDLLESTDGFFLTETQKTTGRLHALNKALLQGLFHQSTSKELANNPTIDWKRRKLENGTNREGTALPLKLKPFLVADNAHEHRPTKDLLGGLTIEVRIATTELTPGTVVVSNQASKESVGFRLVFEGDRWSIYLTDGRSNCHWYSDLIEPDSNGNCHLSCIVDGGPKIIMFVRNGKLDDGGSQRQFGWGRWSPNLRSLQGEPIALHASVELLRVYDRALTVSEAVGNFRNQRQ